MREKGRVEDRKGVRERNKERKKNRQAHTERERERERECVCVRDRKMFFVHHVFTF